MPWWKRRWRRLPFWAWAGLVITGVAVIGSVAESDGSTGGAGVGDLSPISAPLDTGAATSTPGVQPSTTVLTTTSVTTTSTTKAQSTSTTSLAPTTSTTPPPATTLADVPAPVPPPVVVVPVAPPWTVTSVTDGDTIEVAGPDGELTVRLIGINTPERNECWADEATAALTALVAGQPVTLVRDSSDTDQYERALRYVETADGVDVGAALVESGHAISRRYEPDTARSDRYDMLQGQASDAGIGQWASDACGVPVASVSITVTIHPDAAGDDNVNLNDEWVRFTNAGIRFGRSRRLGRRRRVGLAPLRVRRPRARPGRVGHGVHRLRE